MQADTPRPDPDQLLRQVQREEARAVRGRLRVFFGAHAGVGKTYAMLREARQRAAEGMDVVVGVVETHGRSETEALVGSLELLPRRTLQHHGAQLSEFDLDGALARKPALILVDELAHTNAVGSRHAKRWQDVEELLAAGIDVDTTLNVQHLESLGDVVARITQVTQRETVPDHLLEQADELILIDIPPEQFERRLGEGKVYFPEQARRAGEHFFRRGNLIALRELALRRTADRVDAQMRDYRAAEAVTRTWAAGERLLVGVGPSPFSRRLVRATRRMAASLHCEWLAVFVETPRSLRMRPEDRARVEQGLRLAEQMGARTETISGEDFAATMLDYARRQNVTRLVVGKPQRRSLRERLLGSMVDRLIRDCGDIDVYVITGEADDEAPAPPAMPRHPPTRWSAYLHALAVVVVCSLLAAVLQGHLAPANLVMLYLLGLVLVARRGGRGPSVAAAVLSVAVFDFFFVPPRLTFAVADTQYVLTFLVMLLTGLVISDLVVRLGDQAELAGQRERTMALLHALGEELLQARDRDELIGRAVSSLRRVLGHSCALFLPGETPAAPPRVFGEDWEALAGDPRELGAAQWVIAHGQPAGQSTQTLPTAKALYLPLPGRKGPIGAMGLHLPADLPLTSQRLQLFQTIATQLGQAVERETLREEARAARLRLETEQMRNTLLSSVSHELRTPLTVIAGAAESLASVRFGAGTRPGGVASPGAAEPMAPAAPAEPAALVELIRDEADRLDRLVQNLLQMSRMESGMLKLRTEWHVLEELVGNALRRLEHLLGERPLVVRLDPELPLIEADGLLIEQVLINLLENAHKFCPPTATVTLLGERGEGSVLLRVRDGGPGIDEAHRGELFQRFVQGAAAHGVGARQGVGLGLALSAAIVALHGGTIWAHNLAAGGAEFGFSLPVSPGAPALDDLPDLPVDDVSS